jgi:hypothetical protein
MEVRISEGEFLDNKDLLREIHGIGDHLAKFGHIEVDRVDQIRASLLANPATDIDLQHLSHLLTLIAHMLRDLKHVLPDDRDKSRTDECSALLELTRAYVAC